MLKGLGPVLVNLGAWSEAKKIAVAAYSEMKAAPMMESYAKNNRPWKDQSGAARAGLKGGTKLQGDKVIVYIAHSVSYGVHLELANDGSYAILDPTVQACKGEIYEGYRRVMMM